MAKAKPARFLFTVCHTPRDAYNVARLVVVIRTAKERPTYTPGAPETLTMEHGAASRAMLTLTWQANLDTPRDWYAGKATLETGMADTATANLYKLLANAPGFYADPQGFLAYVESKGGAEAVYNDDLSAFVPLTVAEWLHDNLDTYMAGGFLVMAHGEAHARNLALAALASEAEGRHQESKAVQALSAWIAEGQPVTARPKASTCKPWRDVIPATPLAPWTGSKVGKTEAQLEQELA